MSVAGPTMHWEGSSDPDVKSGKATYFYAYDDQSITFDLPDFATAFMLDGFIQSVFQGGKMAGAKEIEFAVQNALKNVMR